MKSLLTLIFSLLITTACESVFFENSLESIKPLNNFEYLWNECNEKYSYFELKNIDWNDVKAKYIVKLYDNMSHDSLFKVLGGMLSELKDDHTNLISNFNISAFRVNYTAQDNFDWQIIQHNYLPRNYYISGPFSHELIANGNVGYIRLSSFTGEIASRNIDFILNKYKNTKGLILDLRENGGGRISDVFKLLSRLVSNTTLLYYSRIKSGAAYDDFSEPQPTYISPYSEIINENKVAVLIDRGTYSAGSFFALATKALPNMFLVGDTTGGGLGLPNGGQLPNGWTYRFSISQTLTLDKKPDYENGVPPDVNVLFDWTNLTKDEIIERAIVELLK